MSIYVNKTDLWIIFYREAYWIDDVITLHFKTCILSLFLHITEFQ